MLIFLWHNFAFFDPYQLLNLKAIKFFFGVSSNFLKKCHVLSNIPFWNCEFMLNKYLILIILYY